MNPLCNPTPPWRCAGVLRSRNACRATAPRAVLATLSNPTAERLNDAGAAAPDLVPVSRARSESTP